MSAISQQHYYHSSTGDNGSEKLEEIDEEDQLIWQAEQQAYNNSRAHNTLIHDNDHIDIVEEEMGNEDEEDDEEDELMIEDASSMSSSPSIPDENINFDLVYALHTFVATVEGQASVEKGDALILMEDTNIYWWLVEVLKTRVVGYIPAENIETPYERLARLNKHRNVEITSPSIQDTAPSTITIIHPFNLERRVTFGEESESQVFHYEVESDIEENEDQLYDQHMEELEEMEEEEEYSESQQTKSEFTEMIMDSYDEPSNKVVVQEQEQQEWQERVWDEGEQQQQPQKEPIDQQQNSDTTAATTNPTPGSTTNDSLNVQENSPQISEEPNEQKMDLRVFAGNIGQGPLFHTFSISLQTAADELIKIAVNKFGMMNTGTMEDTTIEYYLAVQGMDGDEYVLSAQDKPFSIFKTMTDSLTTPMPSLSHIRRISQQSMTSTLSNSSRRPRSSSFSNYEQTNYDEDYVIRFYLHRRIKRAHEREGMLYIKVSLYPDETATSQQGPAAADVMSPKTSSNMRLIGGGKKEKAMKKKNKQERAAPTAEIDRIDKIISVRQEFKIGTVINLALEKFHVPDAMADDFDSGKNVELRDRQLGKYKMSVRGSGQETELNPNELMSNVLVQQQQESPNTSGPITSDILFILRKAGAPVKQSQKQRHAPNSISASDSNNKLLPSQLDTLQQQQDRRPSILDILMDSTPRMGERRPSAMNTKLDPSPPARLTEDHRRPSSSNIESRKPSLNNLPIIPQSQSQQQQQSPSSSSSSFNKSPNSISPSILGFRRSSAQSSSVISGSSLEERIHSDSTIIMENSLEVTPTSSSSILMGRSSNNIMPSASTERKKESFKQQLKRFVGWGSTSASSKKQPSPIPPLLTTPFSSNTIENASLNSPSDMNFVSAPSTPLPPTPGTPLKTHQGSLPEVNTPVSMSRRTSETTVLNDPSPAALAASNTVTAAAFKRLSTVSSVTSSSTSSVTSEEIAAAASEGLSKTDIDDSDADSDRDDHAVVESKTATSSVSEIPSAITTTVGEEPDIQTQYAMWMNSQTPEDSNNNPAITVVTEAPTPPSKNGVLVTNVATTAAAGSVASTKALPPITAFNSAIPAKSPLRNKSSTISNATTINTHHQSQTASVITTTPSQSSCTTTAPSIASANKIDAISNNNTEETTISSLTVTNSRMKKKQSEPLHPMAPHNGQEADIDDLFLLVAHGVDFLTVKENTKWEEEGGYEFHPWNRPQSSFAVTRQEQRQQQQNKSSLSYIHEAAISSEAFAEAEAIANNNLDSMDAALLAPGNNNSTTEDLISPPLTPSASQAATTATEQLDQTEQIQVSIAQQQELSAKRILSSKVEIQSPIPQQQPQQQHQAVDDEELQRIVGAYIVF